MLAHLPVSSVQLARQCRDLQAVLVLAVMLSIWLSSSRLPQGIPALNLLLKMPSSLESPSTRLELNWERRTCCQPQEVTSPTKVTTLACTAYQHMRTSTASLSNSGSNSPTAVSISHANTYTTLAHVLHRRLLHACKFIQVHTYQSIYQGRI